MLARRALLCTLMFGVTIAHAERRSVAVIDMWNDPKTVNLARELNPVLLGHPELQPLLDQKLAAELYGEFQNDDKTIIDDAANSLEGAEAWLTRYDFGVALLSANNKLGKLREIVPTPNAMRIYAQFAFVKAQAQLGIPREAADAPVSLALAHRMDPSFIPDAARYLPDVVEAFEAAKRKWPGKGTVTIGGIGKPWVDGRELPGVPKTPVELELDAGPHVVWLTGDDRLPTGKEIFVEAGKKLTVQIADAPARLEAKVRRARADLRSAAQDPAAKAIAMKKLAQLLSRDNRVRDAVLLSIANGKIIIQTWNDGTVKDKGFSSLREYKDMKPIDLLAPLSPPKVKDVEKIFTFDKPIVDNRRWYERRTWQATMAVGALAAIITGYYVYKGLTDDDFDVVGVDASRTSPLEVRW